MTDTLTQEQQPKELGRTTATISRRELRTQPARVIARSEVRSVAPSTPLREALALMREHRGEPLLVLDGGRLAGIVTERDVLHRVLGRDLDGSQPISSVMTAEPHTLAAGATLLEAMRSMESGHYRNLPLVETSGEVVGVLRQQDLISYVAEAFPQEILNLPPRPHQLMEEPEGA